MKIFISYSRDDSAFVYALAQELRKNSRYQLWIDLQIPGADDWWKSILEAIEWCDCCIFVMSDRSVHSIYCEAEIDYVLGWNKPILPLMHKKTEYPAQLSQKRVQYIDVTTVYEVREVYLRVVESLLELEHSIRDGEYKVPSSPPIRPLVPQASAKNDPKDPFDLFMLAEDEADQGNMVEAERLFQKLKVVDPDGFGVKADARLAEIRLYKEKVTAYLKIVDALNAKKQTQARIAWEVFENRYGLEYDPNQIAQIFSPNVKSSPTLSTEPKVGDRIVDDKGITMVYAPAGKFLMGSDKNHDDQKPQHEQIIQKGFWIDLTPVTNESFAEFINAGGYSIREFWTPSGWEWLHKQHKIGPEDYDGFNDPQQPRVGISWFEAYAYSRWRDAKLPSEMEWEWAARGFENCTYPWGNKFESNRVIWKQNSGNKTAPVGVNVRVEGASWIGALDMSGNVWEWTNSIYKAYPYKSDDGRENANAVNISRTLRGGSWFGDGSNLLRADFRLNSYPELRYYNRGLRVVRSS